MAAGWCALEISDK